MYSFNWPDIFSNGRTNLLQDKQAARSNLKLVLAADKAMLLGDPYFGTNIRKYTFSQISTVFKDLIADEIYTSIKVYVPQIRCKREDIEVVSDRAKLDVNVTYTYMLDSTVDMFSISLLDED